MNRRKESCLRSASVERPEAAHEAASVHRDRFGEVARWGADRTNDRDRTFRAGQCADPARSLIELRETRAQICRVARLARQIAEAPRDLPQRLCPAARG